jgi:hypothetical protein
MQHGGDTKPDNAFGAGRGIDLPEQTHQGDSPKLIVGAVSSLKVNYAAPSVKVSWTTDATKNPQLSSKVEIVNAVGKVIQTVDEVLPEKRIATINATLPAGTYTALITVTDIFNQVGKPVKKKFLVGR